MYGIVTYIWVIVEANVGKDTIHGATGLGCCSDHLSLRRQSSVIGKHRLKSVTLPTGGVYNQGLIVHPPCWKN